MEKKTLVDRIEIESDGTVYVRFQKAIVEGDDTIAFNYHRTAFPPGIDIDAQMVEVNNHLVGMNESPVSAADISRIKNATSAFHTPAVIAKYKERAEKENEQLKSAVKSSGTAKSKKS